MTTPTRADNYWHWINHVEPVPCGPPLPGFGRWTSVREHVTCPACLTAMGEPQVVSGTDAGEGTVAKPDHVAVGQRWRCTGRAGTYVVGNGFAAGWDITWDDDGHDSWHAESSILADEYLGTVPAPAETPPTLSPCARCGKRNARESDMCKQCIDDTAETPAPPGPVEPEPATVHAYDGGRLTVCGASVEGKSVDTDEGHPRVTCGACLSLATPAAPSPGVGEGARELTFAEALEAYTGPLRPTMQRLVDGLWLDWHLHSGLLPVNDVVAFSRLRWRIKPEPLPAPAPKPGMVRELFDEWMRGPVGPSSLVLAERVAREALAWVRREAMDAGWSDDQLGALDLVRERAEQRLLGAEAGK